MLDFPGPSDLHSLFQIFHKYKATLPEIKPPLQENSRSLNIFINLTSKADLAELKGTTKTAGYYPTCIDNINREKGQKIKSFQCLHEL